MDFWRGGVVFRGNVVSRGTSGDSRWWSNTPALGNGGNSYGFSLTAYSNQGVGFVWVNYPYYRADGHHIRCATDKSSPASIILYFIPDVPSSSRIIKLFMNCFVG